ncbi:MAG: pirin family protein [Formosimonas sp.]
MSIRTVSAQHFGKKHGPITRVFSPSDLGQVLKPFIFLDYLDTPLDGGFGFGFHPHSGIATLSHPLSFDIAYEESHGKKGVVRARGIEWMKAGRGVWHKGSPQRAPEFSNQGQAFQLWTALPSGVELEPSEGHYLAPEQVESDGATRVLTGRLGSAQGHVPTPTDMNYFYVSLADAQAWQFNPPNSHTVAWLYVHQGTVIIDETHYGANTLVIFGAQGSIQLHAQNETGFVFGSAQPHPHDLVMGHYSVHTSEDALRQGEQKIGEIYQSLQKEGLL